MEDPKKVFFLLSISFYCFCFLILGVILCYTQNDENKEIDIELITNEKEIWFIRDGEESNDCQK